MSKKADNRMPTIKPVHHFSFSISLLVYLILPLYPNAGSMSIRQPVVYLWKTNELDTMPGYAILGM